jgi:amino acid transporter
VSVVAFEAVALPTVVEYLAPGFGRGYLWTIAGWDVTLTWVLVGVVAAVFITTINILGIRTAARLQLLATVMILLVGVLLVGGGAGNGEAQNLQPLFDNGAKGLLGVLIMVPFMFVGFDVIPQSAEETFSSWCHSCSSASTSSRSPRKRSTFHFRKLASC